MKFREWLKLKEDGTSSSSIAVVPSIVGYSVRTFPPKITFSEKHKKRKKKKKKS
jgi:hypothetical protein